MSEEKLSQLLNKAQKIRDNLGSEIHEDIVEAMYTDASRIAGRAVETDKQSLSNDLDRTIDKIVTSRLYGFPLMMIMLTVVFSFFSEYQKAE